MCGHKQGPCGEAGEPCRADRRARSWAHTMSFASLPCPAGRDVKACGGSEGSSIPAGATSGWGVRGGCGPETPTLTPSPHHLPLQRQQTQRCLLALCWARGSCCLPGEGPTLHPGSPRRPEPGAAPLPAPAGHPPLCSGGCPSSWLPSACPGLWWHQQVLGDLPPLGQPAPQPLGPSQQLPHWGSVHGVRGWRQALGSLEEGLGSLEEGLGGLQMGFGSQLQGLLRGS